MIDFAFMDESHVAAVAALEKCCFNDPWSEKSIASELTNRLSLWLVALEDGEVVGYVGSQSVLDQADMMNIAVHPAHRRKGIGRRLAERLCQELRARNIAALMLEVRVSNEPARLMYENMGFAVAGVRPNYYRNPKEDALIMRKQL